ncbi:MAG: succinylglutamate desuccinylase/aspartoacylase family protein [Rhodoferax sp.]|nr:succinylglutamate desuccinylase/aspartoacylase family protein [Rhodoferax sp.]
MPHHFKSTQLVSPQPGPRLLVLGAVHGNELAGTKGIHRVLAEIDAGQLAITKGSVTFVPITNPLAYERKQRNGDRNLNRNLGPTNTPQEFEDHIANWLCPLMAEHDVLLDLHSFQAVGKPFVMVGPKDNTGSLEPFTHAAEEEAMALCLGVDRFVDGWLSTYARGVANRRARLGDTMTRQQSLDADPRYGVGSTEYFRSTGGYALTLECGQHDDPQGPEVAYRAIINTLAHLGLIDRPAPAPTKNIEALSIYEVIDRLHIDDNFSRAWQSFDPLKTGDLIGTRADGTQVIAQTDGYILFPNAKAGVGQEWFYLARANPRLDEART